MAPWPRLDRRTRENHRKTPWPGQVAANIEKELRDEGTSVKEQLASLSNEMKVRRGTGVYTEGEDTYTGTLNPDGSHRLVITRDGKILGITDTLADGH